MTNKEFIKVIKAMTDNPHILEHAKKLIAVAEAAKKMRDSKNNIDEYRWSISYDLELALKELEGD